MVNLKIKQILVLVFAITISIFGTHTILEKNRVHPQLAFERITQAHYLRKIRNINNQSVIFLGSSSVQGLDVSQVTDFGLNLGIGGEKLAGLYNRVSDSPELNLSRVAVIAAGFNDLCHSSLSNMTNEYQKIIESLKGVSIVISGIQPATNLKSCFDLPDKIKKFNQNLKVMCLQLDACQFVDLTKILNNQKENVFEVDGIHLNKLGYQLWTQALSSAVEHALSLSKRSVVVK